MLPGGRLSAGEQPTQLPEFASRTSLRAAVRAIFSAPEMQIQGNSFLVGSHAFCSSTRILLTPMRTPLLPEFVGGE